MVPLPIPTSWIFGVYILQAIVVCIWGEYFLDDLINICVYNLNLKRRYRYSMLFDACLHRVYLTFRSVKKSFIRSYDFSSLMW